MNEVPINSGRLSSSSSDSTATVQQLRDLVQQFVDERNWRQFHNLKNLSMSLAIEAGELMEHTQWLTSTEVEEGSQIDRQAVAEELCDVLSYTLAIANTLDIDLTSALQQKMVKNRAKYPVDSPRTVQGLPTRAE
ncbi:MAG: nucleotide pyrophosphohydrolase [Pirellulales bacterium]